MASSTSEVNLTKAKELGKYSDLTEFSSGNGRPRENNRGLAAEDIDIIRMCGGCGKHMSRVKESLVCSCKKAIHCSKDCFKSSKHKCQEPPGHTNVKATEAVDACYDRYLADRKANKGPSSAKVTSLMKTTKGSHQRIMNYAERGIPMAAYVVGSAYMERQVDREAPFAIPLKFEEQSVGETNKIAVKWLKVAAEAGVPEAMFCLFMVLVSEGSLGVDRRVAFCWLDKAYNTGSMDYLIQILQTPMERNFPDQFNMMLDKVTENRSDLVDLTLIGPSLSYLLMATRFRELKAWNGKTATGKPFYAFPIFKEVMKLIGELTKEQSGPSLIEGEKKTILAISARHGFSDYFDERVSMGREENNLKFLQGVKETVNPDFQLASQTSSIDGRTNYLISCKHDQVNLEEKAKKWTDYYDNPCFNRKGKATIQANRKIVGLKTSLNKSLIDESKLYKSAGNCELCVQEAKRRLRAVSLGQFSISLTPAFGSNFYAVRYAKEDGVIVQEVFCGYSKSVIRQLLECLMSNPADLHPLAVAEDANLFWPIIWFWGSVHGAVQDSCDKTTLDSIYRNLAGNKSFARSRNSSALAAFPKAAAGEWRIACGNENCVRVDHEVKFNLCAGCKVRRYCDEACQRKDWVKHGKFCKAGKKQGK